MTIISNGQFPIYIINVGGQYLSIFLIILLSISLLIADTKYGNGYILPILGTISKPLLIVFIMIVVYKIILVI